MKFKILILSILLLTKLYGQTFHIKKEIPSILTSYLSGVSDGTAETIKFHYSKFDNVFPNANQNYWNPEYSWTNKYKNNNYTSGPKYFGSTTFLVWTTDGYHMTRFVKNTMVVTTIIIHPKEKKKFSQYLFDLLVHTSAYHLGFHTTYETIFK